MRTKRKKILLAANQYLKSEWKALFPYKPYTGFFHDEILSEGLLVNKNIQQIFFFLAIVSLLLCATGILALVSLTILKRQKELAIRKVLGASLANISYLINKFYIWIFIVAAIIGSYGGALFSSTLIESIFEVYQPFDPGISIISTMLLFTIIVVTIGYKIYEVARSNPAEILKNE